MDLLLICLVIIIPLIAELYIKITYSKYSNVFNKENINGLETTSKILKIHNINNVSVEEIGGNLSDHYDSSAKKVRLSSNVYRDSSVASVAIAAHECGHAIQDYEGYSFLKLRAMLYPVVRVATSISYYIIFLGFLLELIDLAYIGIAFTMFGLLFQIVTLPVEFNASKRALDVIRIYNIVDEDELKGAKQVLKAAALTYVAGVLSSALQILRLILIANSRRD